MRSILNKYRTKFFKKPQPINFEDKVRSMTGKEIVMSMVNGLLNGYYTVDMGTFGNSNGWTCFGCAATHCITEISKVKFNYSNISGCTNKSIAIGCDSSFLDSFECAINQLRSGNIDGYNLHASNIGIAKLPYDRRLPLLASQSWKKDIQAYIEYANTLD
ncbi:MAG: hypothetical protein IT245_03805 [Bacteroidia bacterium]|nr:hypothetical protein [Bacteroidia bacterium]